MPRAWLIATAALGIVCALFAIEALQLALFDSLGPGPGFFPLLLGSAGVALAAALAWQVRTGRTELPDAGPTFDRRGVRNVALVVLILALAAALLEVAGFALTMLVAIGAMLYLLGARNHVAVVLCSLAGSFGVWYLFTGALKVVLPAGWLFG